MLHVKFAATLMIFQQYDHDKKCVLILHKENTTYVTLYTVKEWNHCVKDILQFKPEF